MAFGAQFAYCMAPAGHARFRAGPMVRPTRWIRVKCYVFLSGENAVKKSNAILHGSGRFTLLDRSYSKVRLSSWMRWLRAPRPRFGPSADAAGRRGPVAR